MASPRTTYDSIPPEHTSVFVSDTQGALFNSKDIRAAFVSKVFTILFFQILAASVLIAWFTFHQPTKDHMKINGQYYLYGAFALFLVVYLILVCIESARRSFPANFILLTLLTLSYGLVTAVLASRYEQNAVLCAFGATAFATFVLIILAKCSPFDVTNCGCALCILGLVHLIVSSVLLITLVPTYTTTASLLIAGFGAFLVSLYMVFDLQLIMGGRSNELSPEEYILGAALLYIDILMLFQYMLILFSSRD